MNPQRRRRFLPRGSRGNHQFSPRGSRGNHHFSPRSLRGLMRAGDWLTLAASLALVAALVPFALSRGPAEKALVKRDGTVLAELPLDAARTITVDGAIGPTVIETRPGAARVASDPGPRQYCVQQGWLARAGAVAICAPSHITLQLTGRDDRVDSLAY